MPVFVEKKFNYLCFQHLMTTEKKDQFAPRQSEFYTPDNDIHAFLHYWISTLIKRRCRLFSSRKLTLRWCHNECYSVSNHQPHDCLLNRLFRCRSKKTSKLRVTGLCAGNSPGTGEFPAQMASNAENVSIWWRHHETTHGYQILRYPTRRHTLIMDIRHNQVRSVSRCL